MDCPLCNQHEIDASQFLTSLKLSHNQLLDIATLSVSSCPTVELEIKAYERIISAQLTNSLKISIYKIDGANLRFIFDIAFRVKRNHIRKEKRASPLHSIDGAIQLMDKLKIILLTSRLTNLRKNKPLASKLKNSQVDLGRIALEAVNQNLKPIYKIIREQR